MRRENVVPGDLVRLSAGDLVPADGFLVESRDLYVQQAALTGESMPAEKQAPRRAGEPNPETPNWVFLGTSVVSGTAIVRVTATGARTSFGFIGAKLRERTGDTEFERGLKQFGMLIMRAVLFLVLFILVVRVALHKDAFESFVFAVALAVGLTPEFLPMITSVTLGQGSGAHGAQASHREASSGDSEFRQHRHSLQRQDGNADDGSDDAALRGRCVRTSF